MATSMSDETSTHAREVKLGFIEEDNVDWRLLTSKYFPSKVGGKPAWLSLQPIPDFTVLQCNECGGPTIFLMQVYAPLLQRDDTFHRTIFVFVCTQQSCQTRNSPANFKVLRSQLPLINDFYSRESPNEDIGSKEDVSSFPDASKFQNLCQVCGVKSSKKCGKCKQVFYCSKDHQSVDWKFGHKKNCGEGHHIDLDHFPPLQSSQNAGGIIFEEFELVTEDEELPESNKNAGKSEEERLEEFQTLMKMPHMKGVDGKFSEEELEKAATSETEDDKHFLTFKSRIEHGPKQVLRYSRCGSPLWVSAFNKSTPEDIPPCHCGAQRVFEFQIMPQLLNYLKVDKLEASLDWGTLCIYTCSASCDTGNSYLPEFIWKQDFHADSTRQ